jgi:hypothetical protein
MPRRFSPPGGLTDLTRDADLQAWSDAVNGLLNARIRPGGQLFNNVTNPRTNLEPRRIPWLASPQTVYDHRTRAAARTQVDNPANRRNSGNGQNEYAEWFTHKDGSGNVTMVDFTTELPDYWRFIGATLTQAQIGDIYRRFFPAATNAQLFTGATYNPTNVWNTTQGAMQLIGNINTLSPDALGVIAGAIPWRFNTAGEVIDVQDCVSLGERVFHADPTIVANINRMAREGRAITIDDPFGVYIFGVDTSDWVCPDGGNPDELVTYSRGTPPMHARIAVPPGRTFRLGEVTIAGERLRSGAQIAERTTVGITMLVGPPGEFRFTATPALTCSESIADVGPLAAGLGAADAAAGEETVVVIGRTMR